MITELSARDIATGSPPENLPEWIDKGPAGIRVHGDPVGWRETYLVVGDNAVVITTSLESYLNKYDDGPAISPFGISQLLGAGLMPLPHTVYAGVYRLSVGDYADITAPDGKPTVQFGLDYPWREHLSRHDQTPSTGRLRHLIASSLERQLEAAGGKGLLMLSSGKDSVALAIGLHDIGAKLPCVTFVSGSDDREHVFAARFCAQLGLEHHATPMPGDAAFVQRELTRFFRNSTIPTVDHAAVAHVMTLAQSGAAAGAVVEGSGNDPYMGFLLSPANRRKLRYRVRGRLPARIAGRLVRVDSPVSYLTRSSAAALLPGRTLRFHELRRMYAAAEDIDGFWYAEGSGRGEGEESAAFISRLRHTEAGRNNLKGRLVARSRGMDAVLPFCDTDLADYCFNLPQHARMDVTTQTNKLLLRALLAETLDYDANVVGDGFFEFDGAGFIGANASYVREEIASCSLWRGGANDIVDGWLRALPARPFLWHVLYPMFMVSGWHNHSKYIRNG
jgi:hypothetical protein